MPFEELKACQSVVWGRGACESIVEITGRHDPAGPMGPSSRACGRGEDRYWSNGPGHSWPAGIQTAGGPRRGLRR